MPEKTVQKEPGKKPAPSKKPKPQQEVVVQISLSELHPFPDHPFQVREDASMQETAESVKEYGVLVPALARPREDGGYELIAGHRRKHACELAGLATMPVIVRDIDRDAATIIMVDSNLQRENILPSERAKAYKMKMEAIKRQGARTDLTSPKISAKFRSDDEVGQDAGVSGDTIRNYIALTQLVPELQQITLLLGITISFSMRADQFVSRNTLIIMGLGPVAFVFDSIAGVMFAKLLNLFSKKKVNPMVGAAGISAFPMSARVIQKMGIEADSQNHLLMHAVGANVAGQIASVLAGGMILNLVPQLLK